MRELSPVGIVGQSWVKVAYCVGPAAAACVETGQSCCAGLHQHCLVAAQGDCVLVGTGEALIGVVDAARGAEDGDAGGEHGVGGMQCLRPTGRGVRGPGECGGVYLLGEVPDPREARVQVDRGVGMLLQLGGDGGEPGERPLRAGALLDAPVQDGGRIVGGVELAPGDRGGQDIKSSFGVLVR
ncbi:Uncharacterised protein [Mycobacteroides abscessus subsp. abscessus]|nr:Uncharacterised protein [Mycobacteroides abscessus subsp. abscessus]SID09186.1 Uncharacterised protein [Mycobacteroides abscessus subsp. abscessus]